MRLRCGTWADKRGGTWAGERAGAGKLRTGFLTRNRLDGRRGFYVQRANMASEIFFSKISATSFHSV